MTDGRGGQWLKLSLRCPERMIDAVSDVAGVLSGAGVEITPVSDGQMTVAGFFRLNEAWEAQALEIRLRAELEPIFDLYGEALGSIVSTLFDDADWSTSWQQYFKPFPIVPGLIIKPSWEEYLPVRGEWVMELDPGMAFGTGQHESTRLALSLVRECCERCKPKKVLDVGTGTGVLAMAAALFGADRILAIDNDPVAVRVAGENVLRNQLQESVMVSGQDLATLDGAFDLICANIVHDVLAAMVGDFRRLLAPGGHVVLAGILRGEQEESLGSLMTAKGLRIVQSGSEGAWAALLARG